jgi:hypothetical protein
MDDVPYIVAVKETQRWLIIAKRLGVISMIGIFLVMAGAMYGSIYAGIAGILLIAYLAYELKAVVSEEKRLSIIIIEDQAIKHAKGN